MPGGWVARHQKLDEVWQKKPLVCVCCVQGASTSPFVRKKSAGENLGVATALKIERERRMYGKTRVYRRDSLLEFSSLMTYSTYSTSTQNPV